MNLNENQKKGNTILLTVIAIATLLVAVVGATFAYFTATVTGNDDASSVIVKAGTIGTVTYNDGPELNLENALPGASKSINFSVSATKTDAVIPYSIIWHIGTNDFENEKEELVYTLVKKDDASSASGSYVNQNTEKKVPSQGVSELIGSGQLPISEQSVTHNYTLTVHFKETGSNQNSNQGKSFSGKIEVLVGNQNSDESSSELYYNASNQSGTQTEPSSEAAK